MRIINAEKNAVTVDAKIVDIKSEFATDGGYDYKMYVTYEFNGRIYDNIYVGLTTHKDFREENLKINDKIGVQISSEDPELILNGEQSKEGYIFRVIFFGAILFLLLVFAIKDIRKKV